jgi:hypothetical protein
MATKHRQGKKVLVAGEVTKVTGRPGKVKIEGQLQANSKILDATATGLTMRLVIQDGKSESSLLLSSTALGGTVKTAVLPESRDCPPSLVERPVHR